MAEFDAQGHYDSAQSSAKKADFMKKRNEHGRCATCGAQTHERKRKGLWVQWVPRNVPGVVFNGQCLQCHPLPTTTSEGGRAAIKQVEEIVNNKDGSITRTITTLNPDGSTDTVTFGERDSGASPVLDTGSAALKEVEEFVNNDGSITTKTKILNPDGSRTETVTIEPFSERKKSPFATGGESDVGALSVLGQSTERPEVGWGSSPPLDPSSDTRPSTELQRDSADLDVQSAFADDTVQAEIVKVGDQGAAAAYEKHLAAMVSEHGKGIKYAKNGTCPRHSDVQLREKKGLFRRWKAIRNHCPQCENEWIAQMEMGSANPKKSGDVDLLNASSSSSSSITGAMVGAATKDMDDKDEKNRLIHQRISAAVAEGTAKSDSSSKSADVSDCRRKAALDAAIDAGDCAAFGQISALLEGDDTSIEEEPDAGKKHDSTSSSDGCFRDPLSSDQDLDAPKRRTAAQEHQSHPEPGSYESDSCSMKPEPRGPALCHYSAPGSFEESETDSSDKHLMYIAVMDGNNHLIVVDDVAPSDTLLEVKKTIFDLVGIPTDKQELSFRGQPLGEDMLIENCGIKEGGMRVKQGSKGAEIENVLNLRNTETGDDIDPISINIKTLMDEKGIDLEVSPLDAIFNVKLQIQHERGIPIDRQHICFKDEELEDWRSLSSYNVENTMVLELVLCLQGGANPFPANLERPFQFKGNYIHQDSTTIDQKVTSRKLRIGANQLALLVEATMLSLGVTPTKAMDNVSKATKTKIGLLGSKLSTCNDENCSIIYDETTSTLLALKLSTSSEKLERHWFRLAHKYELRAHGCFYLMQAKDADDEAANCLLRLSSKPLMEAFNLLENRCSRTPQDTERSSHSGSVRAMTNAPSGNVNYFPGVAESDASSSDEKSFPGTAADEKVFAADLPWGDEEKSSTRQRHTEKYHAIASKEKDWLELVRKNLPCDCRGRCLPLEYLSILVDDELADTIVESTKALHAPIRHGDFFPPVVISYATSWRPDSNDYPGKLLAAGVIAELFRRGYPCYSDMMTPGGRDWREYRERFVPDAARAKVLVALLTRAFFQSICCLEEVAWAIEQHCEVLPVRVEESSVSGKDICRDKANMWPTQVIEKHVGNAFGDCDERQRKRFFYLTNARSDAVKKLLKVASVPFHGTLLNNKGNTMNALMSRLKEILRQVE